MIYLQKGPFEMSLFDPENPTRSKRHKKSMRCVKLPTP